MGYDTPPGRFAHDWGRGASNIYVWTAYAVAIGAGIAAGYAVEKTTDVEFVFSAPLDVPVLWKPLILAAVGDIVGTFVIWISAIIVNNSSLYDAYWSVFTPVAIIYWHVDAASLFEGAGEEEKIPLARTVLVYISVWVWAIRLTSNWEIDWPGLHHEDFRYMNIRQQHRDAGLPKFLYWLGGSLVGIMVIPTAFVFAGSIPAFLALTTPRSGPAPAKDLNFLDFVATVVCVSAATLQWFADRQMRRFRRSDHEPGTCMEEGLWRYSRHPNYFGEISFWFGLLLHALAARLEFWWSGAGFLIMVILFVFISIPLMEKRQLKKRPNFQQTINTTSMLIPLPRLWKASVAEPVETDVGAAVEER